jgi:hypothetical protein
MMLDLFTFRKPRDATCKAAEGKRSKPDWEQTLAELDSTETFTRLNDSCCSMARGHSNPRSVLSVPDSA